MVLTRHSAIAVLVLLGASAPARAGGDSGKYVIDPGEGGAEPIYLPELREPVRFVIGFDFGLGVVGGLCDRCDKDLGGLAVDVFSGAQLTPRLAALADVWSVMHLLPADAPDERGLVTHTFATAAARFWALPELYVQAGIGGAMFRVDSGDDELEFAPAAVLGIGRELDHRPERTIALTVKLGAGRYDEQGGESLTLYNIAAIVGWHWF